MLLRRYCRNKKGTGSYACLTVQVQFVTKLIVPSHVRKYSFRQQNAMLYLLV